jgi:sn-glycerol 3-phosphate transport system permease protein
MLPIIIGALGALVGALVLAQSLPKSKSPNSRLTWTLIGAAAGAVGALMFMVPLNFCTFDAEQEGIQVAAGVALIGLGMLMMIALARAAALGQLTSMVNSSGTFPYQRILPLLLLAPTLIILILFLYYPFLETFRLSTLLASRTRSAFVCLQNFTDLPGDVEYIASVTRTFVFTGAIVVLGLSLSLAIAIMAFQPIKGASIYRTLLVWPYAISPAVSGIIFRLLFNPQGGMINYITRTLFGVQFDWLNSPVLASAVVIMASIWTRLGFNILFYIAGLQSIPNDLKEAAAIDGANSLQRFWYITLPLLSPITFFLVVTNVTFAFFEIFGTIDYLTEGGPLEATTVMIYNVFDTQRQNLGLGKAAAQSVVLFLLVVVITYWQFRTAERRVNYGA